MGEPKKVDVSPLEPPKGVSLVSHLTKGLKPKEHLLVVCREEHLPHLKRWSKETSNPIEEVEKNLLKVVRGKGFHGVCLGEKLSFYWTGVKLHTKELLFKLTGNYPRFLINFVSLREGERAIKLLTEEGFRFETLPAPKEIEGYCGFACGFKEKEAALEAFKFLAERKLGVEAIFEKTPEGFKRLLGLWEI